MQSEKSEAKFLQHIDTTLYDKGKHNVKIWKSQDFSKSWRDSILVKT